MKFSLAFTILLAALGTHPSLAYATDNNWCDFTENFDPVCPDIVVRGGGLQDGLGDTAFSTDEFDDIDLERIASGRIENLLHEVPGLGQFRRTDARVANPTSQGVTLRGLGGNASSRALVLLDGVPQSDPFGGWVSWPSFDALPLRAVHVRKGGGSGVEGPGALAGTIELYSLDRAIDAGERFAFDTLYGSNNGVSMRGQIAFASDTPHMSKASGLLIGVNFDRGDGYIPVRKSQRGAVDGRAGYSQGALALKGNIPLGNGEVQANLRGFFDNRSKGTAFSDNANEGIDASLRVTANAEAWEFSAVAYSQLREFRSLFGAASAARSAITPTLDQFSVPSLGLGSRMEARMTDDWSQLRLGVDWRETSGRTNEYFNFASGVAQRLRRAGGNSTTAGIFSEYSRQLSDPLLLTGGIRYDGWRLGRGYLSEATISTGAILTDSQFSARWGGEWTGRAGVNFNAGELLGYSLQFRASAYKGWRLPSLNELYRPFRVGTDATAANALLKPEKLGGYEIGITWGQKGKRMKEGTYLDVSLFDNGLDDAIANVTLAQGPGSFPGVGFVAAGGQYRQRQNLDRLHARGVEAELAFPIGPLDLALSYAFVDAKFRGGPLAGKRPAQVAQNSANARLGWMHNAYTGLTLSGHYYGSQFEDDANAQLLRDALTMDFDGIFRISRDLQIVLRGENLFDAEVQSAINSSGIIERANPRTLWLGMRFVLP
jgi:vitamin B12 transporter